MMIIYICYKSRFVKGGIKNVMMDILIWKTNHILDELSSLNRMSYRYYYIKTAQIQKEFSKQLGIS